MAKHNTVKEQEAEMRIQLRSRDLNMMQSPDCWPRWPYLPVKKYDRSSGCLITGVLISCTLERDEEIQPIIYAHYIHGAWAFDPKQILVRYNDFADLLNDGWVVD
jgi:hypothetical protein